MQSWKNWLTHYEHVRKIRCFVGTHFAAAITHEAANVAHFDFVKLGRNLPITNATLNHCEIGNLNRQLKCQVRFQFAAKTSDFHDLEVVVGCRRRGWHSPREEGKNWLAYTNSSTNPTKEIKLKSQRMIIRIQPKVSERINQKSVKVLHQNRCDPAGVHAQERVREKRLAVQRCGTNIATTENCNFKLWNKYWFCFQPGWFCTNAARDKFVKHNAGAAVQLRQEQPQSRPQFFRQWMFF